MRISTFACSAYVTNLGRSLSRDTYLPHTGSRVAQFVDILKDHHDSVRSHAQAKTELQLNKL